MKVLQRGLSDSARADAPSSFRLHPSALLVKPADGLAGKIDPHALDLRVEVEGVAAHLAAVAGLLVAAEGRGGVEHVVGVNPDHAGLDLPGEAVGARDVARPDAGREAVDRLVGLP